MSAPSILSFGVAFPSLRLSSAALTAAWGSGAARGLKRKPFCSFDEDVISLAIKASRTALEGFDGVAKISALFVGATTLPYEEKPASATIVTAVLGHPNVRTVEIRGSCQAGLQALVSASEYCRAHPGAYALAVATDAPAAAPAVTMEHTMSAGAAAFLVGPGNGIASLDSDAGVTIESFGSRFRRLGERFVSDLELRTGEQAEAVKALSAKFKPAGVTHLALGATADVAKTVTRVFGGAADELWPMLGDAGAASAPIALAHMLEKASAMETVLAAALGSGAIALTLTRGDAVLKVRPSVLDQLSAGTEVDYVAYLKHRRLFVSSELVAG